nr:spore coat protein U domain-containing protein [Rickettsiales endosymbiont of Peranema trichophorum]
MQRLFNIYGILLTKTSLPLTFLLSNILGSSANAACSIPNACQCSLFITPLTVTYNPLNASPSTTIGTATVKCTNLSNASNDISYELLFSAGAQTIDSTDRQQKGTKRRLGLHYNIYKDGAYVQILGNGFGGTYTITNRYTLSGRSGQNSATHMFPIYMKVPIQRFASADTYYDDITVTLDY